MVHKLKKVATLLKEIYSLLEREIAFSGANREGIEKARETYQYFTKPHRFRLFKNKSLGEALVDLNQFRSFEEYYKSINGYNFAVYYARKATKRGYRSIMYDALFGASDG